MRVNNRVFGGRPEQVSRLPLLLFLRASYLSSITSVLVQSIEQVGQPNQSDPDPDIGERVRKNESIAVHHAATGVQDVGHVALPLVLLGHQERIGQVGDDVAGIVPI